MKWKLIKQEFGEWLLQNPDGKDVGIIWNISDAVHIEKALNQIGDWPYPTYKVCDICGKRHGPHGGICE